VKRKMTSADATPVFSPASATDTLRARIAELEEQLQRVTAERDSALERLELLRGPQYGSLLEAVDERACQACQGEGVYWVHDFEMACKRCAGTGRAP